MDVFGRVLFFGGEHLDAYVRGRGGGVYRSRVNGVGGQRKQRQIAYGGEGEWLRSDFLRLRPWWDLYRVAKLPIRMREVRASVSGSNDGNGG